MGVASSSPFMAVAFCYSDTSLKRLTGVMVIHTASVWDDDQSQVRKAFEADKVKAILRAKPGSISNLELVNGEIKTINGSIQRFPTYVGNFNIQNIVKNSLVVIGAIENVGYRLLDVKSGFADLSNERAVAACNALDIANGKLVTTNGKTIISSISGTYPNIPIINSRIAKDTSITDPTVDKPVVSAEKSARIQEAANKFTEKVKQAREQHKTGHNLASDEAKEELSKRDIEAEDREYISQLTSKIREGSSRNIFTMRLPTITNTVKHGQKSHLHDVIGQKRDKFARDKNTGELLNVEVTIDKKISAIIYALNNFFPLYNTVISNLGLEELPEDADCKTMCVSPNKVFWYYEFIRDNPISALIFVFLHECCHVLMRHHSRMGRRDPEMWNIATDLYINKALADELGLESANVKKILVHKVDKTKNLEVEIPLSVLYNSAVDLAVDTPESIYAELMEDLEQQKKQNQNQNQSGQGQSGQGQNQSGQGGGQQGQQGNGTGTGDGTGNGSGGYTVTFRGTKVTYTGQGIVGQQQQGQPGNGGSSGSANGNQSGSISGDMVHDSESSKMSQDQLEKSQLNKAKSIVQGFKLRGGHSDSAAMIEIDDIMSAEHRLVNWKQQLRRFLSTNSGYENTFARPDRRFISRGGYMPGRTKKDPDTIENLKVCIDTSGSMESAELAEMLATVADILKEYKAKAEIIYWDTAVRAVYPFEDIKQLVAAKPAGGGGTKAGCVFNYFETNQEYVSKKKHAPTLVLMFTDGYIENVDQKYRDKYGKKTIWIITSQGLPKFDPPFGRLARYKDEAL
jgi:predicted metal-dependent peptidase